MLNPSQRATIVAVIDPQSSAAAKSSGWIDATTFLNYLATVSVGALGEDATVDAKLEQATSNAGAGAKDVAAKAITQLVAGSKQAQIDLKQEDLDFANGFKFFRLTITPATAATLIAGTVQGFDAAYGVAGDNAADSLAETV